MQCRRYIAIVLLLTVLMNLWPQGPVQAANISDPRDLGSLYKGQPINRIDLASGSDTVLFHDYWTIIVDNKPAGEDLVAAEPTQTSAAYNYIAWSRLSEWVGVLKGSQVYAERETSKTYLYANNKSSTRMHIRSLARSCGATVANWDASQRKVWVITTPWPSGKIPDLPGLLAGQTKSFWVDAYASTIDTRGVTYSFTINGKQVIGSTKVSSNYAGFYVTYSFPSPGSYTLRLEVTDTVGRTTSVIKTINVAPVPQPPQPPALPPSPGQPVADFDLPPLGEVGENIQVVNKSRASSNFWLISSQWTVTPQSYSGSLGMQGGTLVFNQPGVYMVKLKVWDNKNNTSTATKSISISDKLPPPEPPLPPEPENIPPVARFDMVLEASPGVSVPVKNRSYDPDGEIVSVDWSVSPVANASLGDTGGNIIFAEPGTYKVTLTVEDDRGEIDTVQKTISIVNEPPVARISIPTTVFQGEDVEIESNSYDPDGEISEYTWSVTPAGMVGTLSGERGTVYFDEPGTYTVQLTVKDRFGSTGTVTKNLEVKPAVPTAFFRWNGIPKENRKIVFDSSESYGSGRYPVDFSQNQWEFIPPAGVPAEAIRIVTSTDLKTRRVLFKEPGDYRVRLAVKNTKGTVSEWYEQVITVYPDQPPVADFYTVQTITRDPANANTATILLMDRSYSPDGDLIYRREWNYRYDSNNEGSFSDEAWVTLESGNNPTPVLYTNQVGKYEFSLSVEEAFGQETISEFITPGDVRTANTSSKPLVDKNVEVINIAPVVNFDVIKKKKADVVFTIGQIADNKIADLNGKIERFVKPALAANNIDARITSIQTYQMTAQDTFNWQTYDHYGRWGERTGGYYTGQNHIIVRDKNIYFYGYGRPAFKDFLFIPDNTTGKKTFTFDLSESGINYHSMEGGGFLFNSKIENSILSGYVILFGQSGIEMYEIQGVNVNSFHNESSYELSNAPYAKRIGVFSKNGNNHSIKIEVTPEKIDLWDNGNKAINGFTLPHQYGNGFGPIASYASHNCSMLSWFTFNNLVMTTMDAKQLSDVLNEPDWRPNASHFIINLSDVELAELNYPAKLATLLQRMLTNEIYFIGLGTEGNRTQYQTFITQNDSKGVFYPNTNMETALNQTANYIIDVMRSIPEVLEKYVLLGDEILYKTYYEDQENDPKFVERWIHAHDPYWFKNSLGEASFAGQYLPGPVTRFDKVGKYNVQFQARDNPKPDNRFDGYRLWSHMPLDDLELYVHRRPLALYSVQITPNGSVYNVAVQDQSYDPDHQGEAGNGIIAREWRWKEAAAATWNSNIPSTLPAGKTYLFSLKVKDIDGPDGVGEWSLPNVRTISTSSLNMPPVAQFAVNPNPLPLGKTLIYNDLSYDPNGDQIVQRSWRMAKLPGGSWTDYGGTPPNNFTSLGVGDYRIELKVKDQPGAWSEPFYQTVTVIPDNNKPIALFTVSPNPLPQDVPVSYLEASWDPDGDPIVAREWQWQKNSGSWQNGQPLDFNALGIGSYNIRLRVKDQPALAQMTPLWSDWYLQNLSVIVGNRKPVAQFAISPNPALTDEAVTYSDTSYDPDGVGIAERVWQVTTTNGTVLGEYHNQLPPRVFAGTGWGDGGTGTYRIGLRVRDNAPNGISPPLWSDWTWQTLTVVMPLMGSGEIAPNPALSGMRVHITVETSGYAEEVRVKFPDDGFFNGDEIALLPESPVSSKLNTWRGTYLTDAKTPDGPYAVMATVIRTSVALQTVIVPLTLVIQGDIYDQIKVRIRDSR
ncbi:MAG: PKD domain-containing protein [Bacillota bacterium]